MSKDPHRNPTADPQASGKEHHEDDVIVVPKGSSRARFLLTALLAILVLTTFTVTGPVVDVLTGRDRGRNAYMSWRHPGGTVEAVKASDFMIVKQDLSRAQAILSGGKSTKDRDDVQTARHIIQDQLAQEAGVEVTDEELRSVILPRFGSRETYLQIIERYRTTALDFEDTLRSLMRVDRYQTLLSQAFAIPDPATVIDRWKQAHKEYSLESVEIETGSFAEEATAACPSGEELQKWFDGLSEADKAAYRTPIEAKTSAEFAWFSFDPLTNPTRLLAKYPRPESEKPDEVAKTWYEANKNICFRKPGLPPSKPATPDDLLPFEEVKDLAQSQGIANQSVLDWLNDMKTREGKGEAIDFVAEGTSIGLGYRREPVLHTRAEWKGAGMAWSGRGPVDAMFAATSEAGKVIPDVIVDAKGAFVGRITEKQSTRMPEFSEFQDKAREGWISRKKGELALAKLEALHAKMPTQSIPTEAPDMPDTHGGPDPNNASTPTAVEPDSAKFQSAVQEIGLEVKTQDWFDATKPLQPGQATPFTLFLRQVASRHGSMVGAVSKPELSSDKTKAWLARVVASRDPDPDKMTPLEYQNAVLFASFDSRNKFIESTFGSNEFLKQRFGLELEAWRREETDKGTAKKK